LWREVLDRIVDRSIMEKEERNINKTS